MPVERRQDLFLKQPRQARGPRPVDQPFGKGREQFAAITEFGEHDLSRLDGERTAAIAIIDSNRSEEHTSELQSLMRISYAVFCLKKTTNTTPPATTHKTEKH